MIAEHVRFLLCFAIVSCIDFCYESLGETPNFEVRITESLSKTKIKVLHGLGRCCCRLLVLDLLHGLLHGGWHGEGLSGKECKASAKIATGGRTHTHAWDEKSARLQPTSPTS